MDQNIKKNHEFSVVAVILGIVGTILGIPAIVSGVLGGLIGGLIGGSAGTIKLPVIVLIMSVVGLVFAILAKKKGSPGRMRKVGFIFSIIGTILAVISLIGFAFVKTTTNAVKDSAVEYIEEITNLDNYSLDDLITMLELDDVEGLEALEGLEELNGMESIEDLLNNLSEEDLAPLEDILNNLSEEDILELFSGNSN